MRLVDEKLPGIDQRIPTPEERAAFAALVPAYEAALVPASPSEIEEAVTMLALAYPAMRATVEEAGARLELYTRALGDLPPDILAAACMEALRALTFFPAVAEIRDRAKGFALRQWRLSRIRHLISVHDRDWREPEPEVPLSPEQQADLAAALRKLGITPEAPQVDRNPKGQDSEDWLGAQHESDGAEGMRRTQSA